METRSVKGVDRKTIQPVMNLNMNDLIGENQSLVFAMQVNTGIMFGAGIEKGDQVIVDRTRIPVNGNIVIAKMGNDLCIRKIIIEEGRRSLVCPGAELSPLAVDDLFICWGVVVYVLKKIS